MKSNVLLAALTLMFALLAGCVTEETHTDYDCCLNGQYYDCADEDEFQTCNLNDGASECTRDASRDDECND